MTTFSMKPLGCDPQRIKGMSDADHQPLREHYGGAVKHLNPITEQFAGLDFNAAPGFVVNDLKREELIATNSMVLHELFFDGLGEESAPGVGLMQRGRARLRLLR